jgi:hypothetical protein
MNRKEFFKKLGLGALVVAVAPKVLAQENESHLLTVSRTTDKEDTFKDGAWYSRTYKYDVKRGEIEYYYSDEAMEVDYELMKRVNDELFTRVNSDIWRGILPKY